MRCRCVQGERADGAGRGAPAHGAGAQQDRLRARQNQPPLERRDHLPCNASTQFSFIPQKRNFYIFFCFVNLW